VAVVSVAFLGEQISHIGQIAVVLIALGVASVKGGGECRLDARCSGFS